LVGFRNCLAEYTVHSLSPYCGLLTALVLLNSVARWWNTTQFFTKMVQFFMLVCMGVGRIFPGGPSVDFSKNFSMGGAKVVKFAVYHSKLRKEPFFAEIFKFLTPFRHPCLCVGKSSCHTIKNWCNFERLNTILDSEILLNLIRIMKYLADQIQLCFCFCIGNTKKLYFISAFASQLASYSSQTTC